MLDRYTKAVLTVIATCLVWLCVRDFTPVRPAHAQQRPQPVVITGIELPSHYMKGDSRFRPNNMLPMWQTN